MVVLIFIAIGHPGRKIRIAAPDSILLEAGDLLVLNFLPKMERGEATDVNSVLMKSRIREILHILDEIRPLNEALRGKAICEKVVECWKETDNQGC